MQNKKKNYFNKLDSEIKHIGGKKEALSGCFLSLI